MLWPVRNRTCLRDLHIWKAGAIYFAFVFGAGFVLGPIRIAWLVPRFGERIAELMEMPIMLGAIITAAKWIVRRCARTDTAFQRLGIGCIALGLLLVAEFSIVLSLRGLSISEYITSRDSVSGTVYYLMLGVTWGVCNCAGFHSRRTQAGCSAAEERMRYVDRVRALHCQKMQAPACRCDPDSYASAET